MLYRRVPNVKSLSMRKVVAMVGAVALIVSGTILAIPSASAAPVCATKAGIETCGGVLSNGAAYAIKIPSNFKGTVFYWNHGFRPSYPYPGYTPPKGVEEITLANQITKSDSTNEMLNLGYGVAAYDRSTGGLHGWNTAEGVAMLKELVDTTKAKYPTATKSVIWGSSGGVPVVNMFAEKYPELTNAVGLATGVATNIGRQLQSGCDLFFIMSVFFDPTIKGCDAFGGKGVAGHMAALGELAKVGALLTAWSQNLGAPGLEYPAALKGGGIPQRSALLLMGLLAGMPTKSQHMDGITTSALIAEQSINATVAILENTLDAAATGILAGQAVSEVVGGKFYDNTKTDYTALLDEADSGRYNLGLSGDDAIAAMLTMLKMAPRITADATAMAGIKAIDKVNHTSTTPTILLHNEADRLVWPGQSVAYVDAKRAVFDANQSKYEVALASAKTGAQLLAAMKMKPKWNTLALYAMTPETYTKYTDAGLPVLTGLGANSGVGHQAFSSAQTMAFAKLLYYAANSGNIPSSALIAKNIAAGAGLNPDLDFRPTELKY